MGGFSCVGRVLYRFGLEAGVAGRVLYRFGLEVGVYGSAMENFNASNATVGTCAVAT